MKKILVSLIAISLIFTGCANTQVNKQEGQYLSLKSVLEQKFPDKYKGNMVVDIPVVIPCEPKEFLDNIKDKKYNTVQEASEGLFRWEAVQNFEITPYEHYHWQPGYTADEHIPVIVRYNDVTIINTPRVASASEPSNIIHEFYTCGDTLNVSGAIFPTKMKLQYVATDKETNTIYNYVSEGDEIDCLVIMANVIR